MVGRLVDAADFQRVLATAPRVRSAHFCAHHVAAVPAARGGARTPRRRADLSTDEAQNLTMPVDNSAPADVWLGLVLPKRLARRAVTRQLLKRQMREAVRRHAHRLPPGLWVLRLRAGFDVREYPSAASQALRRAARTELDAMLTACAR